MKWANEASLNRMATMKHNKSFYLKTCLIQGVFIIVALFSGKLYAALVVNRSIITYDNPAVNREDVIIINSDREENLFVQVEPFQVVNPGTDNQQLQPLVATDNPEFLVTPNRLAIAPGGRSLVRFLNLLPPGDMERIYRVNLTPVTPPVELEGDPDSDVNSLLEVVVAYQILVIVLPANPNPVMEMDRDGRLATFRNTGNANYLLTDGRQCDPDNPGSCVPLEDRRVYPGNQWRLMLPFDAPFTYTLRTQTGLTSEIFP